MSPAHDAGDDLPRTEGPPHGTEPAVVFVDGDGRISHWGTAAESLLGYPAGGVCGTAAMDLVTAPEDRRAAFAAQEQGAGDHGWDGVVGLRHRDGHDVKIAVRVRPAVDGEGRAGWSVSAADARRVEREKVDRAILEALFSQSPIALTVMDRELRQDLSWG